MAMALYLAGIPMMMLGASGQVLLLFVVTLMINGACISQQVEKKFWVAPLIITRASFGMMIPWSFLRLNEILR